MKNTILILIASFGIGYAESSPTTSPSAIPKITSDFDMKDTEKLLVAGITAGRFSSMLNTIPMIRIGPGYVRYFLSDGSLKIPLHEKDTETVKKWVLTPSDSKKAEQSGADQPATKAADKAPAEVQPPPPTSKDVPR